MLSITDCDPKGTISEVRGHGDATFGHPDTDRLPLADSPTRDRVITMVKEIGKTSFEK